MTFSRAKLTGNCHCVANISAVLEAWRKGRTLRLPPGKRRGAFQPITRLAPRGIRGRQ